MNKLVGRIGIVIIVVCTLGYQTTMGQKVTEGSPSFSPDGSKIVFTSDKGGDNEIYVVNRDGSVLVQLTNNKSTDGDPVWSPDGLKIAFTSDRTGNSQIYVMAADGAGQTQLTRGTRKYNSPAWSPDGLKIAFGAFDSFTSGGLYVMRSDGSDLTEFKQ